MTEEQLLLRRHHRRTFELLPVEGLLPPFLLFAGTAVIRTGPADYHWFPVPANITIGFWALLVLPAFANQRHDPAPTSTY
ncbi:hypothetical protein [Actinoplanes sp. NBRC 101535]|uniref:hypothetical protein n=1 Tax=Actinoplanes sp. NBRC 101535 TaxID=3032196 RepID=UPI00249FA754|nr:hypothetical protein [Actinoplanes sp. NBRC 101535]GLY00792.1 hypothetical protein Acsp01_11710 [Actinoplanes sp. NBRC 101535]